MSSALKSHYSARDLRTLDRVFRLRLINSISGYKSANLIGTLNEEGQSNLAIFNSVVHIGSNPPYLGFIMRPTTVPRHTLNNILNTGHYTINHISEAITEQAHYSSANFDKEVSEFKECGLTEWYDQSLDAPYVKESPIKLGMLFKEKVDVLSNGTSLIVGQVQEIYFDEDFLTELGDVDLEKAKIVAVSGLNHYHQVRKLSSYPYARVNDLPNFNREKQS